MKRNTIFTLWLMICFWALSSFAFAQEEGELAATLEVLSPGVEVLRVNTVNWITVNVEAIVGVGDIIRTDDSGRARITFFADGVETELLPNTEYRIDEFRGSETSFNIAVEVIIGQTLQRLSRLLDANSSYDVSTPGMALAARGTAFAIRVEPSGRSAMLVSEGTVSAANELASADVPAEYGIRAEVGAPLSDVVRADSFEALDAALDGCSVSIRTQDDVRLNVRVGPGLDFPRVGTVDPASITTFIGVVEGGDWYRIPFNDGFGWVLASTVEIDAGCAGLRRFPADYAGEDVSLYTELGEVIDLSDWQPPTPTATATPDD